jgi:hypothetical protein
MPRSTPRSHPLEDGYIEPSSEVFALVGRFLHHWLYVELAVLKLIVRIIRISDLHAPILGPNMDFQRKLNILRVASQISPHLAALRKSDAVAGLVTDCESLYADRNKLAHYHWYMTKKGGLHIARVQATDSVKDAYVVWPKKHLEWKVKECIRVFGALREVADAIKPVSATDAKQVLRLLSEIELEIGKEPPQEP